MKVAMVDLAAQHAPLRKQIEAAFRRVMASGQFVLGENVRCFEEEVAAHLGVDHAVACASGTDALRLALMALGIGPGDEVVTTPYTFFGAVEAILHVGAVPVFVDVDPATFDMDPRLVEQALTSSTRALLPVHLFGQPAAMEALREVATRRGLSVVEDCAQAFGATRGGAPVGTLGDVGCFSFYPTKNLGTYGDGGLVVSHSADMARRLRALRNHGLDECGSHRFPGLNSRLDELQAAVLRIKLPHVGGYNDARRRAAAHYSARLGGVPGIKIPAEDAAGVHVYHQYTVQVPNRDAVRAALHGRGIATAVHYRRPLHREPALASRHRAPALPVAEALSGHCLSLPIYPELDHDRIDYVADELLDVLTESCPSVRRSG